ncbi:MAG TPA: lysylphosphatidylglycerol synthase transmembrane domain-containing protein [Lacipirellulaceae bacterium]|jgi:hypothetical protein|nr:lysylphosphatidylglycerol synthase transmembrane domain-containing protein [Lacipirellulaceae bacterium]
MKKWLVTIFGLCVSAVAIALIVQKIEWRETASLLASVGFRLPIVMVAIYITTFPIRALRWRFMLPPGSLTFLESLKGVVLGFAGNNFLPARGGEFLRMEYLHRKAPNIGRITAISSVLVERILDGLTLLAFMVVALKASHIAIEEHPRLSELRFMALVVFGLACAGAIVIRIWGGWIAAVLRRTHIKPFAWAATIIERFHVAAEFLGFNSRTAAAVVAGICVWLIEGVVYTVACWHFGLGSQSIIAGYLTLTIVSFGLLVPSSPGYIGVFQYMTILALGLFGISDEIALALSLVVHACQYVPTTLWGVVILLRESVVWRRNRVHTAHEAPAAPH